MSVIDDEFVPLLTICFQQKDQLSLGSIVVSGTGDAPMSHIFFITLCVDMRRRRRRRETRQSPFQVPDSNSIFLLSVNERGDRKEVGVCVFEYNLACTDKSFYIRCMILV